MWLRKQRKINKKKNNMKNLKGTKCMQTKNQIKCHKNKKEAKIKVIQQLITKDKMPNNKKKEIKKWINKKIPIKI